MPQAPIRQFYISRVHQQPWVQGNYSDILVQLSNIHSLLRQDKTGQKNEDAAQGFVRSTTKVGRPPYFHCRAPTPAHALFCARAVLPEPPRAP